MTEAEAQMDPLITDMATIFLWQIPETQLDSALPWIENAVTSVLSFVPFFGLSFEEIGEASVVISGIAITAGNLVNGGLQQLQQRDPVAQILGTIQNLGVSITTNVRNATTILDSWSKTIFNGAQDASGRTIM
ncbi:hypothetical protein MMC15_005208 [Xylographa vitiligo]|nr:hypothetical protein [Xylographa vitiligo]